VPERSSYKAGEVVKLFVGYDVMRNSNVGVSWSVNATVYDASGTILDRDGETNAFTTSRSVSPANSGAYIHPRFTMSSAPMNVKVVLDADGIELARTTLVIPLKAADGDGSPPVDGEEDGETIQEAMTVFGIPVMWLAIGGGLVVLLVALSGISGWWFSPSESHCICGSAGDRLRSATPRLGTGPTGGAISVPSR
jgi:hypothetical protein